MIDNKISESEALLSGLPSGALWSIVERSRDSESYPAMLLVQHNA